MSHEITILHKHLLCIKVCIKTIKFVINMKVIFLHMQARFFIEFIKTYLKLTDCAASSIVA